MYMKFSPRKAHFINELARLIAKRCCIGDPEIQNGNSCARLRSWYTEKDHVSYHQNVESIPFLMQMCAN